ncbi:MAG: hypothetical protein HFH39_09745 [Lachnospiraceae bacterium]|nr:hypothetical protein [Lachnospiraceae bacterium]
MKKLTLIVALTITCLYLAGCGSPDRSQQDIAQPTGQAQAAAPTQETSVRKTGTPQSVPYGTAWQEDAQDAQTEWDGQEERKESPINGEDSTEETGETKRNSSEDTVEFMGVDSNEILSCTIYHGEGKEGIDLADDRGKRLLQILDNFFKDPKYTYSIAEGIFDPKYEILENMAKSRKNAHFIYIELEKNITYPLPGATLKNFNTVIIEGNTQPYTEANGQTHDAELNLYYNIENEDYFYYASSPLQEQELAADFMSRYQEWEQAEDWDTALEAQVNFLGSENSFLETCRIYHGKEQIDIVPDEMQNFIQMLSEHIMETKDSWGYVLSLMDLKKIDELKDMAEEEEAKYYILLQFTKPIDTVLEFGSKFGAAETMQLNGDLYILEIDGSTGEFLLYYESGTDNKFISLHPIGDIDNPNKVADFLQRYEKWMEGKLTH